MEVTSCSNGYYIKQCFVHICESRAYLGVTSLFTSLLNPDLSSCVLQYIRPIVAWWDDVMNCTLGIGLIPGLSPSSVTMLQELC
jgi:hypothetical protein